VEVDSLPFTVELAGTVALATDRARYLPGEAVGVTAAIRNDGGASLEGTSLSYGGAAERLRTGVDVGPGQTIHDAFTFVLDPFAAPGPRTLTLGWRLSCGDSPFAVHSASFDVVTPPPAITSPAEGAVLATATPTLSGAAAPG
jgi:hypothetical protein